MNVGLHDLAFSAEDDIPFRPRTYEEAGRSINKGAVGQIDRLLEAIDKAGYGRRLWLTNTAVHRRDTRDGNCAHEHTMVWPTCLQSYQAYMTNVRVRRLNAAAASTLRAAPHDATWEVVDAHAPTAGREDNLENHDVIHWCADVKREVANLVMHRLCGCDA